MMAGYGDDLIATGLARGARARGKRIAFGDGSRLAWYARSPMIFRNNPNIATPGSEFCGDVEWIDYRKGRRIYNQDGGDRWIWNYDFEPKPGELYFDSHELAWAERFERGFVVVEPNVEWNKVSARNKDWGRWKYQRVANHLIARKVRVVQFDVGPAKLDGVEIIKTPDFRYSMAVVKRASLVITSEGGLHHGAAAVGAKAVVIFGGWIPPEATGYSIHVNLTALGPACGIYKPCDHCRRAMDLITVDEVISHAERLIQEEVCA